MCLRGCAAEVEIASCTGSAGFSAPLPPAWLTLANRSRPQPPALASRPTATPLSGYLLHATSNVKTLSAAILGVGAQTGRPLRSPNRSFPHSFPRPKAHTPPCACGTIVCDRIRHTHHPRENAITVPTAVHHTSTRYLLRHLNIRIHHACRTHVRAVDYNMSSATASARPLQHGASLTRLKNPLRSATARP
jgi:hypothetical protein